MEVPPPPPPPPSYPSSPPPPPGSTPDPGPASAAPRGAPVGSPPAAPTGWASGGDSPPQRSGLALASMILGIIGLVLCFIMIPSLLALILGLVAARQIKNSGGALTGSGFARAGWIMGLIGLLGGGALIGLSASGALDDGETAVFDLETGDCVNFDFNPESGGVIEVSSVEVVDCDEPHEGEVIRRGELNPDEDRDYPSTDELIAESSAACGREDLENIFTVFPDEASWDRDGGPYVCFEIGDG